MERWVTTILLIIAIMHGIALIALKDRADRLELTVQILEARERLARER